SRNREDGELRAGVDERVGPAAIELDRKEQMIPPRPTCADFGVVLGPGRRRIRASLLLVKDHTVSWQVEIDVKAAQRVGPQHAIEWPREHARHIYWSNANPAPWYGYSAEGEAT